MSQKNLMTGFVVGFVVGLITDVLAVKTGVNV